MSTPEEELALVNQQVIALLDERRYDEALPPATYAAQAAPAVVGELHPIFAQALTSLGLVLQGCRELSEAERVLRRALEVSLMVGGDWHPAVAQARNNLGVLLLGVGQRGEAESLFHDALRVLELAPESFPGDIANSLDNLATLAHTSGNREEAESLLRRALTLLRSTLARSDPKVAVILSHLGAVLADMGQYEEALSLLDEARAIQRASAPSDWSSLIKTASTLATIRRRMGDDEEAEDVLRDVLRTTRAVAETPDHAMLLRDLASLLEEGGRLAEAETYLREAVAILRGALGPDPKLADTMSALALVLMKRPDFATSVEAEALLREALAIKRADGNEWEVAFLLQRLAFVLEETGQLAEAEAILREALDGFRSASGAQSEDVADTLGSLAKLLVSTGKFSIAARAFRDALDIYEASLGHDDPNVAVAIYNLATVRAAMGDADGAEAGLREAVEIVNRQSAEVDAQLAAYVFGGLARVHARRGDYPTAIGLLKRELEITRMSAGPAHPATAAAIADLGHLYLSAGRVDEAESSYRDALEITRGSGATLATGRRLADLAGLHRAKGENDLAADLYSDALEIARAFWGEGHQALGRDTFALASALAACERTDEALRLMDHALTLNDRVIREAFSIGSERQRLMFLQTGRAGLEGFLSLVLQSFSEDQDAIGMALDHVLRRKALGAEVGMAQRDAVLRGRRPDLAPTLSRLSELRALIARKTLAGPGDDGLQGHEAGLEGLRQAREDLESELSRAFPEMELDRKYEGADRAAVKAALPAQCVLVEFVRFEPWIFTAVQARNEPPVESARYVAFLLTAAEAEDLALVDLGDAVRIDALVASVRASVTWEDETRSSEAPARASQAGDRALETELSLREAVFDPLAVHFGDRDRLLLAPDGDLSRLPFEVLPDRDGQRVLERYLVSYVTSGRDVLRFGAPLPAGAKEPLVAADPDFDLVSASQSTPPPDLASRGRLSRDFARQAGRFDRLEGTAGEGGTVASLLEVTPRLAGEVLESAVKAHASPRILHLATHGFFLPDQQPDPERDLRSLPAVDESELGPLRGPGLENPLLRSGLALAGANTFLRGGALPEEAEDGILTAEDVCGLDLLSTDLVVLSACETGLGEVHVGEGVFGLRRAFVLAGARSLVMSLWKVPDEATRELMEEFYRRLLAREPRAEALRQAQLAVRDRYPDPWYWGAFILQGEPGPLVGSGC